MKRIAIVLMFCIAVICGNAQDAGKILLVKLYESRFASEALSNIKIYYPDNHVETIDLDYILTKQNSKSEENNYKKEREVLDKVEGLGYNLKSSHQGTYLSAIVTTYVFEKK